MAKKPAASLEKLRIVAGVRLREALEKLADKAHIQVGDARTQFINEASLAIREAYGDSCAVGRIAPKEVAAMLQELSSNVSKVLRTLVELEDEAGRLSKSDFARIFLNAEGFDRRSIAGLRRSITHFQNAGKGATRAAQTEIKRGRPSGTTGSRAFDVFVQKLCIAARMNGGGLTVYKDAGQWRGSLLTAVDVTLRAHLPPKGFIPGNVGSALNRIVGKLRRSRSMPHQENI